jgi:hypothetical protein
MNQRSVIMIFHPTSSPYDDEELGTDWVAGGLAIKFCEAVTLQSQQLLWVCPPVLSLGIVSPSREVTGAA